MRSILASASLLVTLVIPRIKLPFFIESRVSRKTLESLLNWSAATLASPLPKIILSILRPIRSINHNCSCAIAICPAGADWAIKESTTCPELSCTRGNLAFNSLATVDTNITVSRLSVKRFNSSRTRCQLAVTPRICGLEISFCACRSNCKVVHSVFISCVKPARASKVSSLAALASSANLAIRNALTRRFAILWMLA